MTRLIRALGLAASLAATSAMAQTPTPEVPEETEAPAPAPAEAPAPAPAEEAPPPVEAETEPPPEAETEPVDEEPAEPTESEPPTPEPTETVEPPPDGGPLPSEDRPSEPVSPEDDLAPTPAEELVVPVQVPVPPPPDRVVEANPAVSRANRLMDITTDITEMVARDGPFAVHPGFGGVADQLVLRGATGRATSDLNATLDGVPLAVPFAGRGVGYTDLEHVPIAAIDRFRIRPGPFDGSYAGSVALQTRRLSGVEGGLLLGEHGHRRLSLAAGRSNDVSDVLMAVDLRRAPHELAGVTDERFSMLARASHQLGEDVRAGVMVRGYGDAWDEPGTMLRAAPAMNPERDATDGGRLQGLGAAMTLDWTPNVRTRFDLSLSFLDDRWTRWSSESGPQLEHKDRDRVWYASARLHLEPDLALPTRIDLGLDVGFDNMRSRSWQTSGRERVFLSEEINGRWLDIGMHGAAEIAFLDELFVGVLVRANQLTVRREDPSRGQSPDTRRELLPSGALWIALRLDRIGVELEIGESHRTAPDAVRGDNLSVDHDSLDLSIYGRVDIGEQWRLDWQATGFGSLYEAGLLSTDATNNERQIWGAEARLDLQHVPSGLLVVGRGGPWFSSLRGSDDRAELDAAGVPDYVMHVGLLRSTPRGLVAEVWLDAYGGHALTNTAGGGTHDETINMTARAGYRAGWGTVWIGAMNLLDDDDVVATGRPDRVMQRPGRAVYGMLDLSI